MVSHPAPFLLDDLLRLIHHLCLLLKQLLVSDLPAFVETVQRLVDFCLYDVEIFKALALHFEMLDFRQKGRFVIQFCLLLATDVLIFAVPEENLVIILLDITADLSRS